MRYDPKKLLFLSGRVDSVGWLDILELRLRLSPAWLKLELGLDLAKYIFGSYHITHEKI